MRNEAADELDDPICLCDASFDYQETIDAILLQGRDKGNLACKLLDFPARTSFYDSSALLKELVRNVDVFAVV